MDAQTNWRAGKLVLLVGKDKPLCLLGCKPLQAEGINHGNKTKARKKKKIYASSKIETTM